MNPLLTPRKKLRVTQHIMEERSLQVISSKLPLEWVKHEYKPDYGIDLVVEIFEPADDGTLPSMGELFFAQAKSITAAEIVSRKTRRRRNVAKGPLVISESEDGVDIECVKYKCEVPLLNTVASMGPAYAVMLLLADLNSDALYFVCLNDYIDKVLFPENPSYMFQGDVTLYIPTRNKIDRDNLYAIKALCLYAQRAKYYAAFNLFAYQERELHRRFDPAIAEHFLDTVLSLDIWTRDCGWGAPVASHEFLQIAARITSAPSWAESQHNVSDIFAIWDNLTNLGSIFEEIVRECFLPTILGQEL